VEFLEEDSEDDNDDLHIEFRQVAHMFLAVFGMLQGDIGDVICGKSLNREREKG
jgi:hypothetical protein